MRMAALAGFGLATFGLAGCVTVALPSEPDNAAVIDGYLSAGSGIVKLHATQGTGGRSSRDCIQVLRPLSIQMEPIPSGRVRVSGRLGVFDNILELAKLNIGQDHATHELCEARFLIVDTLSPISGN